jgi:hypothetical protein
MFVDKKSGTKIDFIMNLTEEEYSALRSAAQPLASMGRRQLFDLVRDNYADVKAVHTSQLRLFGSLSDRTRILQPRRAAEVFVGSVFNWLNSFRLFLDHEETSLKRRFGKDSSEYLAFKSACSAAYDNSPHYRFIYKLRNYATHVGLPVSRVSLRSPTPDDRAEGIRQRLVYGLDRDQLLHDFPWGVAVTADLKSMDAEFDLLPFIEPAMLCLRDIMIAVTRIDIQQAVPGAKLIASYLDRLPEPHEELVLLRIAYKGGGGMDFTPMPLPVDLVRKLLTVDVNDDDVLEPFRTPDDAPIAGPSEPTSTAALNYRRRRAAIALTAMVQEGLGSEGVKATVNDLIAQDGNVEPLLSGALNAGAELLHIAAMAMGRTPQWLLSSMGDLFPTHDEASDTDPG